MLEGEKLTADQGGWSGPSPSFALQWQRCDPSGASCAPIAGAVEVAYVASVDDVGHTLRITVVASNKNGSTAATSKPSGEIVGRAPAPAPSPAPAPNPSPAPAPAACADGVDNDRDGKVDYPVDSGCTSTEDGDETDPPTESSPPPPSTDWVKVADENASFTLVESREVRYGKDATWTARALSPGVYSCSNSFFGDPLVGVVKVCEARATSEVPPATEEPAPGGIASSGDLYFNGDFDTGSLSQWRDFHDAQLNRTPPGFQIISSPRFGGSGYAARVSVTNGADTSVGGDLSMLWDGDGHNSYDLPYLQNGRTTWFRMQFALPDGTDSRFPGKFTPVLGGWTTIYTWHSHVYRVPSAYSTYLGIHSGGGTSGDPATLLLRPVGGTSESNQVFTYLHQTNGAPQTQANRIAIVYNHWYDVLIKITFGVNGRVEWWVDGVQQTSCSCPTLVAASDGSVPGVGHEAGLYRGPSQSYTDTLYIDGVRAGGSRAAVGG